MKLKSTLALTTLVVSGLFLAATHGPQDKETKKAQDQAQDMPMPKPGPEHQSLQKGVGTWDAVMKMGGQEFKGVETVRSFGNGLWIVFDFHCDNFMGMPFDGHGTAGYSPDEKKYVLNWIDSMSTDVDSGTGVSTDGGKTINWTSTARDPQSRKMVTQKRVQTTKDDDHHTLTFYGPGPDGKEGVMMAIEYTRRKK
jgi:hypothetical protein